MNASATYEFLYLYESLAADTHRIGFINKLDAYGKSKWLLVLHLCLLQLWLNKWWVMIKIVDVLKCGYLQLHLRL